MRELFRKKSIQQIQSDATEEFSEHEKAAGGKLLKELGALDLTAFGIAAIVGAGIFSTIGTAAYAGGPAVVFLFLFTAIACGFSALCYAEFAARIPLAGSAYTYAYASFGELIAWIIGWDLLMEYAIGNIAVAISWSDYFTGLLAGYGIRIPPFLTMDYVTASREASKVMELIAAGISLDQLAAKSELAGALDAYRAWTTAPMIGGFHFICDLPALFITIVTTTIIYLGIRESKRTSNFLVGLKIIVVLLVIVLGAFYIHPENWKPFAPNGVSGVLKGVSGVFFAYIGFDAISTTAEECRDPQRDLPRGMIASLIICTILYVGVALVLTGMVHHSKLQVGDPLAFVFGPEGANLPWLAGIVAISAVIAMTTVLLVFQLGQPRIWMAMSRDGLLPKIFSAVHPKYRTPWFSTIVAGLAVALPAQFMNLTEVTDLTSIGTLFAFVLVSGGILFLDRDDGKGRFRVPYVDSRYIVPPLLLGVAGWMLFVETRATVAYFSLGNWVERIPMFFYIALATLMGVLSFVKRLSLIPVLAVLTCAYLMTELGHTNWLRFGIWLLIGLVCYFCYGVRHSRLRRNPT